MILNSFASTSYKLACTATPAPNDHLELGNHAEFLDVMPSNEMIARWFINDASQMKSYRLKRHAEADYWRWVTSWAVCLSIPSDLGYSDDVFVLPVLVVKTDIVPVDHTRAFAEGKMFVDGTLSATSMWREKKATARDRCQRAREIVGDSSGSWIIWCDTNTEADLLVKLFPEAVEVRGSETVKAKEDKLRAFSEGRERVIVTKSDIAGYGLNWQHCHNQVFVGVSYSFEKLYQSLRRSWRFGQTQPVNAHLIYAESEGNILATIRMKQDAHRRMQQAMNAAMREHGLIRGDGRRELVGYDPQIRMEVPGWLRTKAG